MRFEVFFFFSLLLFAGKGKDFSFFFFFCFSFFSPPLLQFVLEGVGTNGVESFGKLWAGIDPVLLI